MGTTTSECRKPCTTHNLKSQNSSAEVCKVDEWNTTDCSTKLQKKVACKQFPLWPRAAVVLTTILHFITFILSITCRGMQCNTCIAPRGFFCAYSVTVFPTTTGSNAITAQIAQLPWDRMHRSSSRACHWRHFSDQFVSYSAGSTGTESPAVVLQRHACTPDKIFQLHWLARIRANISHLAPNVDCPNLKVHRYLPDIK